MARTKRPYRILSLDGGGIRGIYTLMLLERLNKKFPGFTEKVDLFAGTSTGAIIALGLASGYSVEDLIRLYASQGKNIFKDRWIDGLRDLGRLLGAEYDGKNLKKTLKKIFGETKLGDVPRKVLIPTFDLDSGPSKTKPRSWKPKFFHNFSPRSKDSREWVVDVAMRTSAAPTYFPTYQGYVDGGVVANNPSMAALAQALDPGTGKQQLGSIRLLSIGTGRNLEYIKGDRHDWGYARWSKPLVRIMMNGMMGVADYQCRRMLDAHYHRLAPILPEHIGLDATDKAEALVRYARSVRLRRTTNWMTREFV